MDDTPAVRLVRVLAKPRGSHETRNIEHLASALDRLAGEEHEQRLLTGVGYFVRVMGTCDGDHKLFTNEAISGVRDLRRTIEDAGERAPLIVRAIDDAARLCDALSKCGQWRDWNVLGEIPSSEEDRRRIADCVRSVGMTEPYLCPETRCREEYLRMGPETKLVLEKLRQIEKQKQLVRVDEPAESISKEAQAIAMLAAGCEPKDIFQSLGIARQTMYKWPKFHELAVRIGKINPRGGKARESVPRRGYRETSGNIEAFDSDD